jgi:hypothetical protein
MVSELRRFLTGRYTTAGQSFPLPFEEALGLLMETAVAYDSGSFNLVAAGCRSAVESACYLYFGSRWAGTGWNYRFLPRKVNGILREVGFGELLEAVVGDRVLPTEDIEAIRRIQTHGNFIAHYGSRLIRENEETVRRDIRSRMDDRDQPDPAQRPPPLGFRTGIQRDEACQDLADTTRIVRHLMEAAESRYSAPGLQ